MKKPAHRSTDHPHVSVHVHRLAHNEPLVLGSGEHTLVVQSGLLYAILDSGDVALIPGEEIVLHGEEVQAAWNPGRDEAEIVQLRTR